MSSQPVRLVRATLAALTAAGFVSAATAQSASAPANGSTAAVSACERAARAALSNTRGPAADVSFNAPPIAQPGAPDASETMLRGAGRVHGGGNTARTFTYSCNVDARSGEVSGVVVRDAVPASSERAPVAAREVEPDLSNLSPAACESAAAAALKRRWPNVSKIAFNPDTRALQQDSAGRADLRGQGTAQPAPGGPDTHFTYHCGVDARSGRVTSTRILN